ncbi:DUF6299 family protein [Streptomyces diastatochromogenes]|nr:DUF6299 family protein [Streptomyces diastatochromogenes]
MRVRLVLAAAALLTAAVAPLAHAEGVDGLTIDAYGTLAADATVSVSGTYRCLADSEVPVFVSSNLKQGSRSTGIGGTRAVCDGHLHTWTNSAVVKDPAYRPGAARVEASLVQLTPGGAGLPLPGFLATEQEDIELR